MIKTIFFDFDGVIAESVDIKHDSFYDLYKPFGENVALKVKEHNNLNGGISRFEKFKIYHEKFLGKKINQSTIDDLSQKYSELVMNKVINSHNVDGALDFIEKYNADYQFFIITGTPKFEIDMILKGKNISNYFIEVFGSPQNKKYWNEHIIKKYNLSRNEIVFIGDSMSDYDAALFSKLNFILRTTSHNEAIFSFYNGLKIADLNNLNRTIKEINLLKYNTYYNK